MKILRFPHPKLFQVCKEVTVFGPELTVLLEAMYETMILEKGIGLAANQVGLGFRMFTMEGPNNEKIFLVNPNITYKSLAPANIKEGCLSAPGEFVFLPERASWVEVRFQDETGTHKKLVLHGIHAVCVQHEIDHLNGISYMQSKYLSKKQRIELSKKWGLNK